MVETPYARILFTDASRWLSEGTPMPEHIDADVVIEHFLEYLDGSERILFFNRLSDVTEPGPKIHITVPYYSHPQAFANWALMWPPISEHSFLFLSAPWRAERPYTQNLGYTCDFDTYSYEYTMVDDWLTRHDDARTFGVRHNLGVVTTLDVTLQKVSRETVEST